MKYANLGTVSYVFLILKQFCEMGAIISILVMKKLRPIVNAEPYGYKLMISRCSGFLLWFSFLIQNPLIFLICKYISLHCKHTPADSVFNILIFYHEFSYNLNWNKYCVRYYLYCLLSFFGTLKFGTWWVRHSCLLSSDPLHNSSRQWSTIISSCTVCFIHSFGKLLTNPCFYIVRAVSLLVTWL